MAGDLTQDGDLLRTDVGRDPFGVRLDRAVRIVAVTERAEGLGSLPTGQERPALRRLRSAVGEHLNGDSLRGSLPCVVGDRRRLSSTRRKYDSRVRGDSQTLSCGPVDDDVDSAGDRSREGADPEPSLLALTGDSHLTAQR